MAGDQEVSEEIVVVLKPFEGSTVNISVQGDNSYDIEELFADEEIPADLTAEKLVELMKGWFGRSKKGLISDLDIGFDLCVSIDNGPEAMFE